MYANPALRRHVVLVANRSAFVGGGKECTKLILCCLGMAGCGAKSGAGAGAESMWTGAEARRSVGATVYFLEWQTVQRLR